MAFLQWVNPWTVDYGDGREAKIISVPHAWRLDVPAYEEGPVVYRTRLDVPPDNPHLHFQAVSFHAEVFVDGQLVGTHDGIWDAFTIPLRKWAKKRVEIEVRVTKNGGPTYPVRDVASGFLPYVFHTFGGIHGEVSLHAGPPVLEHPAKPTRVTVEGTRIFVDGEPFFVRGTLHWGWYPEHGHTNPPDHVIRREVRLAKDLGFNLIKFCLWVPPHRTFDILAEEGMFAWMELPLWDPSPEPERRERTALELERIVRQYRHHDNILLWTIGCELSANTPADFRQYMTQMVRNLTGCPLVKDNSGGAEMYGGDLREYGTFQDMHPYGEVHVFPLLLDSLLPGGRASMPTLLGETNDFDVHRDTSRLGDEVPFWCSSLRELNDQGVRWQYDLPVVLPTSRFAIEPEANGHEALMESSRRLALFVRKSVTETFRSRSELGGYVITGWRDTPISSAGMVDDWGQARFTPEETHPWNGPEVLFLLPTRRPPWVNGGNRPGWLDPHAQFVGQVFFRIGVHSERGTQGGLAWQIVDERGEIVARGAESSITVAPLTSMEVGWIHWEGQTPGQYRLDVRFGDATNTWGFAVRDRLDPSGWAAHDPLGLLGKWAGSGPGLVSTRWAGTHAGPSVQILHEEVGTVPMPFFREAAYEFRGPLWDDLDLAERWEQWISIAGDRALDPAWLASLGEAEVLMNRIDTRTYAEHPVIARVGSTVFTTLRPFGGIGVQPRFVDNPSGHALLAGLMESLQ